MTYHLHKIKSKCLPRPTDAEWAALTSLTASHSSFSMLRTVVPNWGGFCLPGDVWQWPESFLISHLGMRGEQWTLLLVSSGLKPRMLLNILQWTGQSFVVGTTKEFYILWSKVSTGRNPGLQHSGTPLSLLVTDSFHPPHPSSKFTFWRKPS